MVTTLTLNPCVDRTITINGFRCGGTNKITNVRSDISGKGINVSIALHQLGRETLCVGFNYSGDDTLTRDLSRMGIAYDLVDVPGKLRINIKAFDADKHVMTEFNEGGGPVSAEDVESLMNRMDAYIERSDIMVINGSAPPGVPSDLYKRMIEKTNAYGKKAILDAYGPLLTEGIKSAPFLIKPNRDELDDSIAIARKIIVENGVKYVCISMGKEGALLVSGDRAWFSEGADVPVRGVQGAGDSLVSGICMAILDGVSEPEILHYGVAVAHGSLIHDGTQMCMPEDFKQMMELISVREI